MEFMKSLILENASGELSTHSPQASPGRHEPGIMKSKSKPSFKAALSKTTTQLLHRKPTKFTFFSALPKELQLHIIKLVLQIGKVVVVNYHPSGKGRGWWSDLHPYLRVNRIFRDETLRLRPKSFAHFEKLKEGEETQESEDKEGCEEEKGEQGSKRTVKKPRMIEPPQIDFDFSCDVLAVDVTNLWPTLLHYNIPDLHRLETLILCWRYPYSYALPPLCWSLYQLPNLKSIALISGTSFDHGRGRVVRGAKRYLTAEGPFSEEENYARVHLALYLSLCKPFGVKQIEVCSLRWTRFSEHSQHPLMPIHKGLQRLLNRKVVTEAWCPEAFVRWE